MTDEMYSDFYDDWLEMQKSEFEKWVESMEKFIDERSNAGYPISCVPW